MEAIMYVCDTVLIMLTGWIDSYSRKIIHNTHHTPTFLLKWPQIKKKSKKTAAKHLSCWLLHTRPYITQARLV
jgi:hypothetical protein